MPKPLPRGVLVALEGIDGSGKTTQTSLLEDWAEGLEIDVVRTKEPTTGPWGARIRNSKFSGRLGPEEELTCFLNDRREHVEQVIRPALLRGALVLVDRYYYSTVAYQGARGLDPKELLARNREFAPVPDLVFLLDIEPQQGLERIHTRGAGQDLFETLGELTKAREIFLSLDEPHIVRIDAARSVNQIHGLIVYHLMKGPMLAWVASMAKSQSLPPLGAPEKQALEAANRIAHDPTISDSEKVSALLNFLKGRS